MTLRTFVVEDNDSVRMAMTELLVGEVGAELVGHAATEATAVLWLLTHPQAWDLVVVDLLLAHGNGLRVLAACRVRNAAQKMVVLTAHSSKEMRRRCMDLGANAVFDKAMETEALLAYCAQLAKQKTDTVSRPSTAM